MIASFLFGPFRLLWGSAVRIAIHQPNFLPWLGYFYKVARADLFVLLDDVQFTKEGFIHRNWVKTCDGKRWFGVPVYTKGALHQEIRQVRICRDEPWQRKLVGTLMQHYSKASYYAEHAGALREIVGRDYALLVDLNIKLLEYVCGVLGISTPMVRASELRGVAGTSTARLISICQSVGATEYLSGSGGKKYQDEEAFRAAGIELIYRDFVHPAYPQLLGPFESKLSVIDLLFNAGPESRDVLLDRQSPDSRPPILSG